MGLGKNRNAIGPDFIRYVSVGCDPICTDHTQVDFALLHDNGCHAIRDQRHGNTVFHQFPRRQPGALKNGPSLVRKDVHLFPLLRRRPDHSQGRTISGGCQRPGVTVREDVMSVHDEAGSLLAHGFTRGNVFLLDRQGFLHEPGLDLGYRAVTIFLYNGLHPRQSPKKIHGRGAS